MFKKLLGAAAALSMVATAASASAGDFHGGYRGQAPRVVYSTRFIANPVRVIVATGIDVVVAYIDVGLINSSLENIGWTPTSDVCTRFFYGRCVGLQVTAVNQYGVPQVFYYHI